MLYPNKINIKKNKKITKILLILSFIFGLLLYVINKVIRPDIFWSELCIIGIIYIWITTVYSLKKNTNIAAHVLLQSVLVATIMIIVDLSFGFKKWSFSLCIPLIVIIANISMIILTIVSHKKYIRYVIYQLILCILSTTPFILLTTHFIQDRILVYVATGISLINFIVTISLCKKDIVESLKRTFHT